MSPNVALSPFSGQYFSHLGCKDRERKEYKTHSDQHKYLHSNTHPELHTHTHVHVRAHARSNTHTQVHTHTQAHTHTHKHTHKHTHTHTHAHTHASTHTHKHRVNKRLLTKQRSHQTTDPAILLEPTSHEDNLCVVLPQHSPKVVDCVRHGALCSNVAISSIHILNRRQSKLED